MPNATPNTAFRVGWHTLKKMLAHDEPPGYRQAKQRPKPKLEPFLPVIRQILEDDSIPPTEEQKAGRLAAAVKYLRSIGVWKDGYA